MHGDQLIMLTRLQEREVTAANLEKTALFLADAMNNVIQGA